MKLGLEGKRAVVLGASKGLGAAIAQTLAAEGATVIGAARSVDAIEKLGENITGIKLDLADPASVQAFIDGLVSEGGADILINNSGGPAPGEAATIPSEDY